MLIPFLPAPVLCECEYGCRVSDELLTRKQVSLKFNTKLGGVNHVLHPDNMKWLKAASTMVCGMDVTHPGPASAKGTPSIAGVVASIDDLFAQYPASLTMQHSKQEVGHPPDSRVSCPMLYR